MRFWPVLVSVALASIAQSPLARADINGGKVQIKFLLPDDFEDGADSDDVDSEVTEDYGERNELNRLRYFNRARCQCDKAGKPHQFLAEITWATNPTSVPTQNLDVYTGGMCEDSVLRPANCKKLDGAVEAAAITQVVRRTDSVGDLLGPQNTDCSPSVTQATYGLYSNTGGADLTIEDTESFAVDLQAPEVPATVKVLALEETIRLEWDQIATPEDYEYFQALCSTEAGAAVHTEDVPSAKFDSIHNVCGGESPAVEPLTITNAGSVPGGAGTTIPSALLTLDDAFVCGEVTGGTARSIDLGGLQNDVPYWVVLVAVDKAGNYTARYVPQSVRPQPVTDFWEYLNEEDPEVAGGLCLIESAFGGGGSGGGGLYGALHGWRDDLRESAAGRWLVDRYYGWGAPVAAAAQSSTVVRVLAAVVLAPLIALALAWHVLTLPGLLALVAAALLWRRARPAPARRRLALAMAATTMLLPTIASAQSVTPYWEEPELDTSRNAEKANWHVGIRLGVYWPSIDERFTAPGPYQRTFSDGKGMLPMLDIHRVMSTRYGQFGLGGSAGYFSNDAPSYLPVTDTTMPGVREQSVENRSYFRLVPLELTATYRLTQLDDQWSIPLVPYLRGGLGYYVWWMKRPNGDISEACDATGMNCDRALGASLGWVAAGGLSIRAERIDAEAVRSMRESGIDHAGFFAEVSMAKVDGFGDATKLSVGDATWFAGIDFEF